MTVGLGGSGRSAPSAGDWSPPDTVATSVAMFVMSYLVLVLLAVGAMAVVPLAWPTARAALRRRNVVGLLAPTLAGAGILIVGSGHFAGNGWPGTGGHAAAHQGLVPARTPRPSLGRHALRDGVLGAPGVLAFPATEIAWMVLSPVALACVALGAVGLGRQIELSPRLLRYEARG